MSGPPARTMLVLGGQRSGKSRYAEGLVAASGRTPVYIATATPGDEEMQERIALHRARRGGAWRTLEEPLALAEALGRSMVPGAIVLVDCLTLWLSNLMEAARDVDAEASGLVGVLQRAVAPVVIVSNEVGAGVIPENALARRYADALGVLNQQVAAAVDQVVLMSAGLPLLLKPAKNPEIVL